jgi:hypothetical protein
VDAGREQHPLDVIGVIALLEERESDLPLPAAGASQGATRRSLARPACAQKQGGARRRRAHAGRRGGFTLSGLRQSVGAAVLLPVVVGAVAVLAVGALPRKSDSP